MQGDMDRKREWKRKEQPRDGWRPRDLMTLAAALLDFRLILKVSMYCISTSPLYVIALHLVSVTQRSADILC
jgi:hypothetical protein